MVEISRIRDWRLRAEELRTAADSLRDRGARKGFLEAAETYDQLAEKAEQKTLRTRPLSSVARESDPAAARRGQRRSSK